MKTQAQPFNRPFEALRSSKFQTWGQAMAHCRIQAGLSYRDVADRCGASVNEVRDWEMGLAVPKRPQLKRMQNMCFRQIRYFTFLLPEELRAPPTVKPADPDEAFVLEQATEPPPPDLMRVRPEPKTFADALKYAREEEGLSRQDLAEVLEVTDGAIRAWEERESKPYVHNYEKLLQLFPAIARVPRPADMRVFAAAAPKQVAVPSAPSPAPAVPVIVSPAVRTIAPAEEAGAAYGRAMAEAKRARAAVTSAEAQLEALRRAVVEADEAVKRAHEKLLETM